MNKLKLVEKWIKELERFNDRKIIHTEDNTRANYKFFTNDHAYSIVVRCDNKSDYLGCTVSTRKPLAGEEHTRGNDLPDGKITKKTWNNILKAIVRYELVTICEPIAYKKDEENK